MSDDRPNPIVLYDGVCGLCNRSVQFILKRDKRDRFRFATLQSEFARDLLQKHGITAEKMESVCLVVDHGLPTEQIQVSSTASIAIARELGAFWRFMVSLLAVLPLTLRDWGYNLIARYRYRIFGKYDTCPLPDPRNRHKFLDVA